MTTKTKDVTELSFHCDNGPGHFAVDVKYHGPENYGSLDDADRQAAYESAQRSFWADLSTLAEETFGPGYTVYSEGRSGGWAVPGKKIVDGRVTRETHGFTVEDITESKALRRKCVAFRDGAKRMLAGVNGNYLAPIVREIIEQRDARIRAKQHECDVLLTALSTARALADWKYAADPALDGIEASLRKRKANAK